MSNNFDEADLPSTKRSYRPIVYALIFAVVIAIGGYMATEGIEMPFGQAQSSRPPSGTGPNVGMLAPDFNLKDIEGNEVRLSDLRGKAVMINFWATWCPPCRIEMPAMEAVYRERADRGLVILAVSLDDDVDAVPPFVKEFGLTFPVVLDTNKRVAAQYRVRPIPTTFFVDREGVIRDVQIGALEKKVMVNKLAKIM